MAVALLWVAALGACGTEEADECACRGEVAGGSLDLLCGEDACLEGNGYLCSADGTVTVSPPACVAEPDCDFPPGQVLSQPCCREHGADACGALLFCAAFDGRTAPTCYPERSRLAGAECDADVHCVSESCHPALRQCRSLFGEECTPEIGCAPSDATTRELACIDERCAEAPGVEGDPCGADRDCEDGFACEDEMCTCDSARTCG